MNVYTVLYMGGITSQHQHYSLYIITHLLYSMLHSFEPNVSAQPIHHWKLSVHSSELTPTKETN
jgi:hypothetical protein